LIRFEHLSRAYTRAELAKVLRACLCKYNIKDRVMAITIDNVSNNNTLVLEIEEMAIEITTSNKDSASHDTIVHILCLSYII
jgi:hypothetical protein